jgi:hypothetical protein
MKKRGTSRILIKLKEAHAAKGESVYEVAKNLNMSYNTVKKYVKDDAIVESMPPDVLRLASYYGLDWRDVVQVIEVSEEDESSGQLKTLLAAMA